MEGAQIDSDGYRINHDDIVTEINFTVGVRRNKFFRNPMQIRMSRSVKNYRHSVIIILISIPVLISTSQPVCRTVLSVIIGRIKTVSPPTNRYYRFSKLRPFLLNRPVRQGRGSVNRLRHSDHIKGREKRPHESQRRPLASARLKWLFRSKCAARCNYDGRRARSRTCGNCFPIDHSDRVFPRAFHVVASKADYDLSSLSSPPREFLPVSPVAKKKTAVIRILWYTRFLFKCPEERRMSSYKYLINTLTAALIFLDF